MDKQTKLIRGLPLMARLANEDLQALASTGTRRGFRANEFLFRQGDEGDSIYVVVTGRLRVSYTSPNGDESTVAMMGPGEACGDLSLLDGRPRSAAALATEATETLVISRQVFLSWIATRPKAALALLETLSLLVRRKDIALAELAFVDLSHRLAKCLVNLLDDAKSTASGVAKLKVTQSELAAMLGVTRESVNKELNAFVDRGWVALSRGSVSVQDATALEAHSAGEEG